MKDPSYSIRKAYFTALNGSITLDGANVPVYDRVPNTAREPYVRIAEQTGVDDSSKGCFGMDTTILLDVVTSYKSGGGKRDADVISNQILTIIVPYPYPDASPDFKIYGVTLDSMNTLESIEPNEYTVRKLLRLRNAVHEISTATMIEFNELEFNELEFN